MTINAVKTVSAEEKLAEYLEELIASGECSPGERLPSLRELTDLFRVTAYSAHSCLKRLQKRGLITLRHGSGAYVADKQRGGKPARLWKVTVFSGLALDGHGYLSRALAGIQQAAMERRCPVTLKRRDYYEFHAPEPALETEVEEADGLIMLGEYDYGKLMIPPGVPVVGVEMAKALNGVVSPVSFDPLTAAELAVKYYRKKKVAKVKVFYLSGSPVAAFRAECFRFLWRRLGEVEIVPCRLQAPGVVPEAEERGHGLLFCGGDYCERSIAAYRTAAGRELAADFAVLSLDGKSLVMPSYTPVPTIAVDWQEAGMAAYAELIRRLEQPASAARRISLIPKLFIP